MKNGARRAPFSCSYASLLESVSALAMLGEVEAFALLIGGDTQADDQINDLEDDRRANARPDDREQDALELRHDLRAEIVSADHKLAGL